MNWRGWSRAERTPASSLVWGRDSCGAQAMLRYLAHFPDKGRMIIPGKKLYLHGASDGGWGGEGFSMKSTTGAYLALGDVGVVWSCRKLQRTVSDSSTAILSN